jgi:plastocyanin
MMRRLILTSAFALALASACGGPTSTTPPASATPTPTISPAGATIITIKDLNFIPLDVTVAPGTTITVQNLDGIAHSLTSEAAMGQFSPGSVNGVSFDTGVFSMGEKTITIPANAAPGTVVPYFCRIHLAMMPQGTITVQTGAATSQSPTSSPASPAPAATPAGY